VLFTIGYPEITLVVDVEGVAPVNERWLVIKYRFQGVPFAYALAPNIWDLVKWIVLARPQQGLRKAAQNHK